MYRDTEKQLTFSDDFFLRFCEKLNKNNRWVILDDMIPWWKAEEKYSQAFKDSNKCERAFSVRVALGSLIIKE